MQHGSCGAGRQRGALCLVGARGAEHLEVAWSGGRALRALGPRGLERGSKHPTEQVRQLQLELEKMVVGTTTLRRPNAHEDGLGINDRVQFERWLAEHQEQLELLDAHWA